MPPAHELPRQRHFRLRKSSYPRRMDNRGRDLAPHQVPAVLSGILMAQAIAALYASPLLHPADFPRKLLQSVTMISLSFIIAGIFYFTYEYRFKRMLVEIRRPLRPVTTYMGSYAASAEARDAKKLRYAWLRRRARKLAADCCGARPSRRFERRTGSWRRRWKTKITSAASATSS
jgi:hypothetical protein